MTGNGGLVLFYADVPLLTNGTANYPCAGEGQGSSNWLDPAAPCHSPTPGCQAAPNPIWINEYTLCVAVSGDHQGTAGNLPECPAYSLDAQTKARVVEDDYLVAMDIARALNLLKS